MYSDKLNKPNTLVLPELLSENKYKIQKCVCQSKTSKVILFRCIYLYPLTPTPLCIVLHNDYRPTVAQGFNPLSLDSTCCQPCLQQQTKKTKLNIFNSNSANKGVLKSLSISNKLCSFH